LGPNYHYPAADVAYLPYVNFSGVDDHFFGNTGQIARVNPESSTTAPACKPRR
jgi:hypothetical protein